MPGNSVPSGNALDTQAGVVGRLVREWRAARGFSQLQVALRAAISSRHLSYVETGRAQPGRNVVLRLGEALRLSDGDLNELLRAAGFAAVHSSNTHAPNDIGTERDAFQLLLDKHEPYFAVVVDREWQVVLHNRASSALMRALAPRSNAALGIDWNLIEGVVTPRGLAPAITNGDAVARALYRRVAAASRVSTEPALFRGLLERIVHWHAGAAVHDSDSSTDGAALPLQIAGGQRQFTMKWLTLTLSRPLEPARNGLQLEAFYPGDAACADFYRELASRDP